MMMPGTDTPVWVVQSLQGRDRKRVFLAFRTDEKNAPKEPFPSIYTVNGTLHRIDRPKKKHLSHVKILRELDDNEKNALITDYSNKTVAILVQKYDEYGELSEKREKDQKSY